MTKKQIEEKDKLRIKIIKLMHDILVVQSKATKIFYPEIYGTNEEKKVDAEMRQIFKHIRSYIKKRCDKMNNEDELKLIEENIKKYGEVTLYLFDGEGYATDQKKEAEYMFNSNNCIKTIDYVGFSAYLDTETEIWFGYYEYKNLMWSTNNELIDNIKSTYNYGTEKEQDAEMRQVFKQIRSKY